MKTYTVRFYEVRSNATLRILRNANVWKAEEFYCKHSQLNSVRNGSNAVEMKEEQPETTN